jgi:SAM-dependent methyltransferase
MAQYDNFYHRAFYYDIVFNRDVRLEVEFICQIYQQYNPHPPHSMIDLACGPAYHARTFARDKGKAIGLDLREEMLTFAAQQAQLEGVSVEFIAADMRSLQLTTPVDIALNAFDGIDCLNSNVDLIDHFQAIANCLTPNGLYFVDVTHPYFTSYNHYTPFRYHGERDGITVDILWATNKPHVNPLTHIAHTELQVHINDGGKAFMVTDTADERILTAQEIMLLAELSGALTPVAWYGSYDVHQPFCHDPNKSPRMIAVLQKR